MFPRDEFDRHAAQLSETSRSSQQTRDFMRVLFSGAADEGPDKQGRVTIPEHLRRYAHLERDVAVIGAGAHFEIWDRPTWTRYLAAKEPEYSELADANPDSRL